MFRWNVFEYWCIGVGTLCFERFSGVMLDYEMRQNEDIFYCCIRAFKDNTNSSFRYPLTRSSIWSPLGEEKLQNFQPDAKRQQNPTFLPSQAPCLAQGQAIGKNVNIFYQHYSDTITRQLQSFNAYNAHTPHPPPNLPLPNKGSAYLPQSQWNKYNSTSALDSVGSIQNLNKLPAISEVFFPQNEMTGPSFGPHDDQQIQISADPLCYEPYSPQAVNQIVNSFQSLMTADHEHLLQGDTPVLTGEKVGLYQEEKMNYRTMSTHAPPTSKEMVGDYGKIHMEKNRAVRSKLPKCTSSRSASLPHTQTFQQAQFYSGSSSLHNRQQKIPLATKSTVLPVNVRANHHYRQHAQQGQSRNKPQLVKEKRRTHMSGSQGEGYSARSASNFHTRGGESKRYPPPNSPQPQTCAGDNVRVKGLSTQQLGPAVFHANNPAGHSAMNFSNFISTSKTPGLETSNTMAANEFAGSGELWSDTVTHQGVADLNGEASAAAMNEAPMKQLHLYLEECHSQWKLLEMETEMVSLTVPD